jgi:glyoxylase-like metal-dependent hydrolase (beta-lactamase superfamily II)
VERTRRRAACSTPEAPLELAGCGIGIDFAPGHTAGSVVFRLPGHEEDGEATPPLLLSGDVLFAGSIGRTDLPGGSWEQMQASLASVILPMAGRDGRSCPGTAAPRPSAVSA